MIYSDNVKIISWNESYSLLSGFAKLGQMMLIFWSSLTYAYDPRTRAQNFAMIHW